MHTFKTSLHVGSLLVALAVQQAAAQGLPAPRDVPYLGPITLQVDATDLDHKVLRVRESLPVRPGRLTLLYPQWIPGDHAPSNEVKRLTGLRIEAAGKVLAWQRNAEHFHAFTVEVPPGTATLDLSFEQVLPLWPSGTESTLRRALAKVQWQGSVLYPAGHYASRIDVDASLRLPAGWGHGSALRAAAQTGDVLRFERVSLETLLDSPVLAGRHFKRVPLDESAARPVFLDVAAESAAALQATEEQLQAHRNLVRQADLLFGARHFAHYDLLLALSDDEMNMGLEHHQSSENSAKAGYFTDWAKSTLGRHVVPHEYVHSWNGKFRRPRDLWAPTYNTPTRNSLLWVYEGQTQYWGEVLAARSGLYTPAEARERLARIAAQLQYASPGRTWRSLQDTTDDEIITGRRRSIEWSSWQRFEDYYNEGLLIWLDVDTRIREMSGGRHSLDDFARGFFGVDDGRVAPLLYDSTDVTWQLGAVQPHDWAAFLRAKLDAVGPTAPLDGLERAGWRLGWTDKQSDYVKAAETYSESADFVYSLGLRVGKEDKVSQVVWDGPAFRAGMTSDLTLLAVNWRSYKADVLRDAITAAKADGSPIELLLKDGDHYRLVRIDYRGGLRYPQLERIEGKADLLTAILSPR